MQTLPPLDEILREANKKTSGSEVTTDGGIVLGAVEPGEQTKITTSDGTDVLTIDDDGQATLGAGQAVKQVVTTINPTDPNNDTNLANVTAIENRIEDALSSAVNSVNLNSKAEFDTFLLGDPINPSSVFVSNSEVPFDYTDTNGRVNTGITYWQGFVEHPVGGDLSSNTQSTSNSANVQTGAQIKTSLFAEPDTNNLNDTRANVTDTIEATVATGLDSKVDTVPGQGLSQNNFTNALATQLGNTPANTNAELLNKLSLSSLNTNVVLSSNDSVNGSIEFNAVNAPVDQKRYKIVSSSSSYIDITGVNDAGLNVSSIRLFHNGNINLVSGTITQSGNAVLDVSDSKYSNLPNDTVTDLAGKVAIDGAKVLSDVNFSQADKDKVDAAITTSFNGGTITSDLIANSSDRTAITLKTLSNGVDGLTGIAWQNTGDTYTGAIGRANDDGDIWIFSGNNTDLSLLEYSVKFNSDRTIDMFGDLRIVNDLTSANYTLGNQGAITLSNTAAPNNQRTSKITHEDDGTFTVGIYDNNDVLLNALKFNSNGDLLVSRHIEIPAGDINMTDDADRNFTLERRDFGVAVRSKNNVPAGEYMFRVLANSGGMEFGVEFNGNVVTGNNNIKVGTSNDGTGGNFVFHEGNRELIGERVLKLGSQTLTTSDLIDASGTILEAHGVGANTITMPTVSDDGTTNGDFQHGESFKFTNANSGSDITFSLPADHQFVIRRINNISTSNITLQDGETISFTAIEKDLGQYTVKSWFVRVIATL